MSRSSPFQWRPAQAGCLIVLALFANTHAVAQSTPPCGPGESLLSLGKAAFFRAIERGAFAIGERTLDDLLDGLGEKSAPRPSATRNRATVSPVRARAAVFLPASDAALALSLQAYVESPSSDAADAALQTFLEEATKVLFETPPEKAGEFGRMGLVLEGRQFQNRSSTFGVADMASERGRRKLDDTLFGGGLDLDMGKADRRLGAHPFFKAPIIADTRNVDRNNLGIVVKKELDLRKLWFEDYRSALAEADPSAPAEKINEALNAGWPTLQKFWAFKRTEVFIDRAQTVFGTQMREVNQRFTREKLPLRDCEKQGR